MLSFAAPWILGGMHCSGLGKNIADPVHQKNVWEGRPFCWCGHGQCNTVVNATGSSSGQDVGQSIQASIRSEDHQTQSVK